MVVSGDMHVADGYHRRRRDSHEQYSSNKSQHADLGNYGSFELEIAADDGTMTWKSNLQNISQLATDLNITGGIPILSYHLHQSWNLTADFAIGASQCGVENLGNHYDPYFAVC